MGFPQDVAATLGPSPYCAPGGFWGFSRKYGACLVITLRFSGHMAVSCLVRFCLLSVCLTVCL